MLSFLFALPLFAQTNQQDFYYPKREFRGVWVATVNNIDWPSRWGMTAQEQKNEFIELLDFHQRTGINAVIVQVRAMADAIYPSNLSPWAKSLTGKAGKAPTPFYDPLAFMIEEAHKRNMEFHAWLNPFRVATSSQKMTSNHVSKEHPEWILTYGSLRMLNPGLPKVREYLVEVIQELITNYDIDGIHFDDYFYPYPEPSLKLNDYYTYKKYKGDAISRRDWRRRNINKFIKAVHNLIVDKKPMVKFGISPFGVWRNEKESPEGSPTKSGYTCYDHLYADVRLWLQAGWLDYIAPQIYQSTKHKTIPYKPLVEWWSENTFGKHLYIGHAAYRVGKAVGWKDRKELPKQVRFNRKVETEGSIMYNSSSLMYNREHLTDSLRDDLFYVPALMPTMPWIDNVKPLPPVSVLKNMTEKGLELTWNTPQQAEDGDLPNYYVIYSTSADKSPNINNAVDILAIVPSTQKSYTDSEAKNIDDYKYLITSLDRLHNESEAIEPIVEVFAEIPKEKEKETPTQKLPFSKQTIKYFSTLLIQSFQ